MREFEDLISVCNQRASRNRISRVVTYQKCHTCEACRKLKGQDSWITTGQKVQSSDSIIWRLKLATHPSHESLANAPCFAEKF